MLVHADETGYNRPSAQIKSFRVGRISILKFCALDAGDFTALDLDPLILSRRCAGAIDDAHVVQHQDG